MEMGHTVGVSGSVVNARFNARLKTDRGRRGREGGGLVFVKVLDFWTIITPVV